MKRELGLILSVSVLSSLYLPCASQNARLRLGGSLSVIAETETAQIYGPGLETRTGRALNTSLGFKAAYVWEKTRLAVGVSYAPRNYKIRRPFDYCTLLKPGEVCPEILAHVSKYRYETIEFPISIELKLFQGKLFSYYVGGTYVHSVYFKSVYDPYIPDAEKINRPENLNAFSKSIRGQLGITYHPNNKWALNAQPFIAIISKQKGDKILFDAPEFKETWWDSFGLTFDVFFGINRDSKK